MSGEMNGLMKYRWLEHSPEDEPDWKRVEEILKFRGWMSLNRPTSRVLIAEDMEQHLAGFICFQLIPYVGPIWLHPAERGSGIAEEMARQMWEFLLSVHARGWMAGAESVHTEKLCEKFGMTKIEHPMFVVVGMEERRS